MKSKSQIRRIASQQPIEIVRQLRRIADNLDEIAKAHTELPFIPFDAEWVRRAASIIEALPRGDER